MNKKLLGALFFIGLSGLACSAADFDVGGSHLALADRHDFDESGNAFLRFEEDRSFSFFLSGAEFKEEAWLTLSVLKQRVIEENITTHDGVYVGVIPLSQMVEGAVLTLSEEDIIVLFSEPGRFLDENAAIVLEVEDVDITPTSGSVEGTLRFNSLNDAGQSEEHVVDVDVDVGRERVVKANMRDLFDFLSCAIHGEDCIRS